jgi:hypothetical protein
LCSHKYEGKTNGKINKKGVNRMRQRVQVIVTLTTNMWINWDEYNIDDDDVDAKIGIIEELLTNEDLNSFDIDNIEIYE